MRSISTTIKYDRVTYDGMSYPGVIVDGGNLRVVGNAVTFGSPASNIAGGYDSVISSRYTSSLGVNPADIIVDGGAYVGPFSSYAPEELIPGRMYDSLNIQVFSNVAPNTNDYAFRIFTDMNQKTTYYRIAAANTTELASNLHITDGNIHVVNSSLLPIPNPTLAIPGVIFIGGEKITYYTNDTVNNVLGQIRRAVNGTPGMAVHTAGELVVDASIEQVIPYSTPTFANIGGNLTMQDTSWYTPGVGHATTGTGLINSTTVQAQFLLASPGYTP